MHFYLAGQKEKVILLLKPKHWKRTSSNSYFIKTNLKLTVFFKINEKHKENCDKNKSYLMKYLLSESLIVVDP